ncbi:hypothetical protein SAMN05444745_111116 [Arthrobacter sp. OV608]|nr:hypothetical protein SAMN05444745_111116 [Arthrobacter sp. OV608]
MNAACLHGKRLARIAARSRSQIQRAERPNAPAKKTKVAHQQSSSADSAESFTRAFVGVPAVNRALTQQF